MSKNNNEIKHEDLIMKKAMDVFADYNVPYKVDNSRERDCLIFDTAG